LKWHAETFDEAEKNGSLAVMLVVQANPFEEDRRTPPSPQASRTVSAPPKRKSSPPADAVVVPS
jgi:predicted RNase H-like HicB family nuclease